MTEQEREDRKDALGHAVRHKSRSEQAREVVKNAEQYLAFLKDKKD